MPFSCFFILITVFWLVPLSAQSEVENGMELMIFKEGNDFDRIISSGQKVIVYTNHPVRKLKGILSVVDENTIMVDNVEVALSNVNKIKHRNERAGISGRFSQGIGITSGLISAVLFLQVGKLEGASATVVGFTAFVALVSAVLFTGVGAIFTKRVAYDVDDG